MIGKTFPSEKRTIKDQKTGHEMVQLTNTHNNFHLYFTENSFVTGNKELIFFSDRGSSKEYHYNLFHMNLESGEMVQLTDEANSLNHSTTKTKDGKFVFFVSGNQVKRLNTQTLQLQVIYETDPSFELGMSNLNASENRLGFTKNERVQVEMGPNYGGFLAQMFAVKRSFLTTVDIDGNNPCDVFADTHWMGHFQFSSTDDTLGTFCHEGPWNLVQQRIWLIDFVSRNVYPCVRQQQDDSIGHEFWTRDGLIFFDNRRAGHDGTITSNKTQAYATETNKNQKPYVGFANSKGQVVSQIEMPFYCNHYHANNDNSLLVGDSVEDLELINIKGKTPKMQTLCHHGTSWYTHSTHCHPTFDWAGNNILYTSDCGGKQNLYLIDSRQIVWE